MYRSTIAQILGVLLLLGGILGFFPNPILGAKGLFPTNIGLNIAHLLLGSSCLFGGITSVKNATLALKVMGVLFLLLAIAGLIVVPSGGLLWGIVPLQPLSYWIYLGLGVVVAGIGFSDE